MAHSRSRTAEEKEGELIAEDVLAAWRKTKREIANDQPASAHQATPPTASKPNWFRSLKNRRALTAAKIIRLSALKDMWEREAYKQLMVSQGQMTVQERTALKRATALKDYEEAQQKKIASDTPTSCPCETLTNGWKLHTNPSPSRSPSSRGIQWYKPGNGS